MTKIWWKAELQKLLDRRDSDSPFTDLPDVKEICSGGKWIFWILGFSDCFDHKVVSQRDINNSHFVEFKNLPWWQHVICAYMYPEWEKLEKL